MTKCGSKCLLLLAFFLVGCGRTSTVNPVKTTNETPEDGPPQAAIASASQATEASQFRDALHLFSRYIIKSNTSKEIQLTEQQRNFVRQQMFLSEDELQEVETATFRPLDSHYLECFALLRDAARNLEKAELPPLDLARHTQGWVCRQVVLAAPGENSWMPSDAVLHMGFGNARDRALLFLAMLRQLKPLDENNRLEGCVLIPPHPLVGVLIPSDPDNLYLFDMVLGIPVPGPKGEGIATLAQVRKDPGLLKAAGVPQADFESSEYYLNCPLSAISARMKTLEGWLMDQDRPMTLFMDVAEVHKAVAHAAQKPVRPGNPATKGPPSNSPTRIMRWFQPQEEGGQEFSRQDPEFLESRARRIRFELQQRSRPRLVANFRALKLFDPTSTYVPKDAGEQLLNDALDLVLKFSTQPREMLVRGQTSALLKRLNRVGRALEEAELMDPAELQSEVANWRQQARDAFLSYRRRDPKAMEKMQALWSDSYLHPLLDVSVDLDPKKLLEPTKIGEQAVVRKHITHMVFAGCKDVVDQNVSHMWAMSFHEESAALQAAADALKPGHKDIGAARQRALESWPTSVNYWNKFVDRFTVSPTSLRERLAVMLRSVPSEMNSPDYPPMVLSALPNLLHDWARSCSARLNLARALHGQGQDMGARRELDNLARDLAAIAGDDGLQRDLDAYMDVLNRLFQKSAGLAEYRRVADEFKGQTLTSLRKLTEVYRQQWTP